VNTVKSLLVLVLLSACAQATPINIGDGRQAYLIECPGAYNKLSTCVKKANELCPSGYDIAGSSQTSTGGGVITANQYYATVTPSGVERSITVVCKG
jgi:hypothetical protein